MTRRHEGGGDLPRGRPGCSAISVAQKADQDLIKHQSLTTEALLGVSAARRAIQGAFPGRQLQSPFTRRRRSALAASPGAADSHQPTGHVFLPTDSAAAAAILQDHYGTQQYGR